MTITPTHNILKAADLAHRIRAAAAKLPEGHARILGAEPEIRFAPPTGTIGYVIPNDALRGLPFSEVSAVATHIGGAVGEANISAAAFDPGHIILGFILNTILEL